MTETAQNVLLVVLDTVRARSTFMNGRQTTPNLRTLSEEGLRFDRAITPAPWTLPAHASMFTGLYPSEHGTTRVVNTLSDEHETVAQRLRAAGFDTGLFTPNMFLTEYFNMDRGFDVVNYIEQTQNRLFNDAFDPIDYVRQRGEQGIDASLWQELTTGPVHKNIANALYYKLSSYREGDRHAEWDDKAVASATSFIEDRSESDRFFAMINLVEAHAPWSYDREVLEANDVPVDDIAPEPRWRSIAEKSSDLWEYAADEFALSEKDREILQSLYESWIRRVDTLLANLLDTLERCGVREETLVVVTADHGERLGVDGVLGHHYSLHEDVTHVPLVCSGPSVSEGVVDGPVSLKDLYGTILRSTGVKTTASSVFDDDSRGVAFTETDGADPDRIAEQKGKQYRSVATQFGRRSALYTTTGRAELRHQSGEIDGESGVSKQLEEFLESLERTVEGATKSAGVPEDIGDRLEHLGYR